MIHRKSAAEIAIMQEGGRIVAKILSRMKDVVVPGITTMDIANEAEKMVQTLGVVPAFKGYNGYPAVICVSVNEEVVHGIPSRGRVLTDGDIVGLDFGVLHNGFYADAAVTLTVGLASPETLRLLDVTRDALYMGIEAAQVGNRIGDISHAVQSHVESNGLSVVKVFVGHGIGRKLHEEPQIPNYGDSKWGVRLKKGMTLAIEPMVNVGSDDVRVLEDGWTAVTSDGSLSAHFEHTIAVTDNGPRILTIDETIEEENRN
jgi:methionyl aminopeptidase